MSNPVSSPAADDFRERVLERFTERAERVGVRRVRMDEIAADLRVSKRTIYEAYPRKEDLVRAFVAGWMGRINEQVQYRRASNAPPIEQLKRWARNWSRGNGRVSDVLWQDIRAHYPEIYAEYRAIEGAQMKDTTDAMRARMHPDIDADVAIAMFAAIRRMVQDPRVRQRLDMSMEEALLKAVEIWARGAYAAPYDPIGPENAPERGD